MRRFVLGSFLIALTALGVATFGYCARPGTTPADTGLAAILKRLDAIEARLNGGRPGDYVPPDAPVIGPVPTPVPTPTPVPVPVPAPTPPDFAAVMARIDELDATLTKIRALARVIAVPALRTNPANQVAQNIANTYEERPIPAAKP